MKKYPGASPAPRGIYMNLRSIEFTQINEEPFLLPGTTKDRYVHLPFIAAAILGPILGLVFIIFLPLMGIVGLIYFVAYKAGFASTGIGRKLMQPFLSGWKPGVNH